MSLATATTWTFNFIVSLTFPSLVNSFTNTGAFGWYAAWCALLFVLILFFLPESKGFTLEELDQVFSVPTGVHAKYQLYNIKWHFKVSGVATGSGATERSRHGVAQPLRTILPDSAALITPLTRASTTSSDPRSPTERCTSSTRTT
jgi:hypothetical protein